MLKTFFNLVYFFTSILVAFTASLKMSSAINNSSSYIQWQVIRKNSAFLKRQRGIPKLFSTEKFNTQRVNSIRHNGLVNKKAVDVQVNIFWGFKINIKRLFGLV